MAIMFVAMLAVAATSASSSVGIPEHLRPANNAAAWVSNDDYPVEAQMAGVEGVVGFKLDIDRLGNVAKCTVVSSSGSQFLDHKTCKLLPKRAKFIPGKSSDGQPTGGTYSGRFRWQIDRSYRSLPLLGGVEKSFMFSIRVDIDKTGRVARCEVLYPRTTLPDGGPCRLIETASPVKPYLDASGNPTAKVLIFRRELELRDD